MEQALGLTGAGNIPRRLTAHRVNDQVRNTPVVVDVVNCHWRKLVKILLRSTEGNVARDQCLKKNYDTANNQRADPTQNR